MDFELTDEIRQAVYDDDCARRGHAINVTSAVSGNLNDTTGENVADVMGPDDDTLPHLTCWRCNRVWLVIPTSGVNYKDTMMKVREQIGDVPGADRVLAPRPRRKKAVLPDHGHEHVSPSPGT